MLKGKGTLEPLQRKLLFDLGKVSDISHFYLTGGTALAEFFLAHRHSYDIDLFTAKNGLVTHFSKQLEKTLLEYLILI